MPNHDTTKAAHVDQWYPDRILLQVLLQLLGRASPPGMHPISPGRSTPAVHGAVSCSSQHPKQDGGDDGDKLVEGTNGVYKQKLVDEVIPAVKSW